MRSLGLVAGDLDDSQSHWAVERRKLESGENDGVVIIGALADPVRHGPRRLAGDDRQAAGPARAARHECAALPPLDSRTTPISPGSCRRHPAGAVLRRSWAALPQFVGHGRSPGATSRRRSASAIAWTSSCQRQLAFLDDNYSLFALIDRIKIENDRAGVDGPYFDVWKLSDLRAPAVLPVAAHRERRTAAGARAPGLGPTARARTPAAAAEQIDRAIEEAIAAVRKIRARGGEVVFVRPPSIGPYFEREEQTRTARDDLGPLLAETGAFGIHFEDYPEMQGLESPEWSHLTREDAARFTRAYVGVLVHEMPWLRKDTSAGAEE